MGKSSKPRRKVPKSIEPLSRSPRRKSRIKNDFNERSKSCLIL